MSGRFTPKLEENRGALNDWLKLNLCIRVTLILSATVIQVNWNVCVPDGWAEIMMIEFVNLNLQAYRIAT